MLQNQKLFTITELGQKSFKVLYSKTTRRQNNIQKLCPETCFSNLLFNREF